MKLGRITMALTCLLGFATALQAQQVCNQNLPEVTPTSEFIDHQDGTVTHSRTGLMWKRCAEGQNWSGGTCTGAASDVINWSSALQAGRDAVTANHSDWRLPNIKELESIVEGKCYSPSINASIFPNTSASHVWSASAHAYFPTSVWYVYFLDGRVDYGKKVGPNQHPNQVRLVRAGKSYASYDSYGPLKSTDLTPILMLLLD